MEKFNIASLRSFEEGGKSSFRRKRGNSLIAADVFLTEKSHCPILPQEEAILIPREV